jgi:hypothetical protein
LLYERSATLKSRYIQDAANVFRPFGFTSKMRVLYVSNFGGNYYIQTGILGWEMGFILRGPFSDVGKGTPQYKALIFEEKAF